MKKRDKTMGRKKSGFRGDLWILLLMGFLLLWVVLAHEFQLKEPGKNLPVSPTKASIRDELSGKDTE
jgi:hypothetical protein